MRKHDTLAAVHSDRGVVDRSIATLLIVKLSNKYLLSKSNFKKMTCDRRSIYFGGCLKRRNVWKETNTLLRWKTSERRRQFVIVTMMIRMMIRTTTMMMMMMCFKISACSCEYSSRLWHFSTYSLCTACHFARFTPDSDFFHHTFCTVHTVHSVHNSLL